MNIEEFEIEKTWEAMVGLGPISTAAQLSSLTLLLTACLWVFGADSSDIVEVPIVGVEISAKIAAGLSIMLGSASYVLVTIFNSYRLLLERKLQELMQARDPAFRLGWHCKYPGVTTYLANVRGRSRMASLISLALFIGTLVVPIGFLVLLTVLGSRWWAGLSYWLFALPSTLFLALGFGIFFSSELTPDLES